MQSANNAVMRKRFIVLHKMRGNAQRLERALVVGLAKISSFVRKD